MPAGELAALVKDSLPPQPDEERFVKTVDALRSRYTTLHDFALRGRPYFADDFETEPGSLEKLNAPGCRELLRELGARIEASPEFTEASVEAELRKLAEEKGVKAGLLINGSRAALTGQLVGPSAFLVFLCIGRQRTIERLKNV